MTVVGATFSLPLAPASVGLPGRQQPLRLGDEPVHLYSVLMTA